MGLNVEFRVHVESMCLGGFRGFLSKTSNEVWDFFEYLGGNTWEFDQAKEALVYSFSHSSAHHFELYHHDQFRDPCF